MADSSVTVGSYTYATDEAGGVHTQKMITEEPLATTATPTTVAAANGSFPALAANTARKGLTIYNNSNSEVFVSFSATAGANNFSFKLQPGSLYEMPNPIFGGEISVYWAAASPTGSVVVTELS